MQNQIDLSWMSTENGSNSFSITWSKKVALLFGLMKSHSTHEPFDLTHGLIKLDKIYQYPTWNQHVPLLFVLWLKMESIFVRWELASTILKHFWNSWTNLSI